MSEIGELGEELLSALNDMIQEFVEKGGHDVPCSAAAYRRAQEAVDKAEKLK